MDLPTGIILAVFWCLGSAVAGPETVLTELLSTATQPREEVEMNADVYARANSQHHMIQRQAGCTPESVELDRRIATTNCDPDFVAALSNFGGNTCGFPLQIIAKCGTDSTGTLCELYDPFLRKESSDDRDMLDVAGDIIDSCFRSPSLSETLRNCSSRCRNLLQEFADRFGCCIHTEPSITEDGTGMILAPYLWSQCSVTLPDPCENAPRTRSLDSSATECSFSCAVIQSLALECKYLGNQRLNIYEECSDTESANEVLQDCGFNEKGEFCGALIDIFGIDFQDIAFSVYNKCFRFFSSNECPTECKPALIDLKDTYGCCINSMNTTSRFQQGDIEVLITRYDLWSVCNVETPGLCSLPADPSVYDDILECSTCVDL